MSNKEPAWREKGEDRREGSWEEQNEGKPESESMLCEENNVAVYCVAFLNSVSVGRKLEGYLILELIIT